MSKMHNISKISVVQSIIDQIVNCIISGEFSPGLKIPSEQELAAAMGVSRNSVREAVKTLISYGVLEIKRPEGTYVCKGFSPAMINPSVYGLVLGSDSARDVLMLRKMFDIGIMTCVIDVANNGAIDIIEEKFKELETAIKASPHNLDAVVNADLAFHIAIEQAAQNPLLHIINDMITQITLFSRRKTIETTISSGNTQLMIDLHHSLLSVLKNRDKCGVSKAVEDSYTIWKSVL